MSTICNVLRSMTCNRKLFFCYYLVSHPATWGIAHVLQCHVQASDCLLCPRNKPGHLWWWQLKTGCRSELSLCPGPEASQLIWEFYSHHFLLYLIFHNPHHPKTRLDLKQRKHIFGNEAYIFSKEDWKGIINGFEYWTNMSCGKEKYELTIFCHGQCLSITTSTGYINNF